MSRFRPGRDVPDIGPTPAEQARFKAWIRTALVEIAEDLAELGRTDTSTVIEQESVTVPAGALRRVTPPVGGMGAVLPAPTAANTGQTARIMIEAPVGALTVESAPGVNDAGQVFLPTINGQPRATFTASGLVTFTSNGVNDWKSSAEFAAESAAGRAGATAQAALDATYVLETPHPSLPNAGQATDTAEIDFSFVPGGAATWSLIDGGVPLTRLEDIPDQRVLGNDSGVDGPVTPVTVHQELDWLTSGALWLFDGVDDRVEFADANDIERTDLVTLSAWLRTSDGVSQQAIAGKLEAGAGFRGWELGTAAGRIYFLLCSAFGTSNAVNVQTAVGLFPAGALTHVAVSYTGTSIPSGFQFYINGSAVLTDFIATSGPITTTTLSTQALEIGVRANTNTLPFAGEIHHVAKFNAVLTAAQILEVYNAGTPPDLNGLPTAPAPVWWVKLDELDAVGANGILDYGTGSNEGTAAGGLNPGTLVGSLITRSTSLWQTIPPGTDGLPFVSQGPGAIPAYEALTNAGLAPMAANTIKANATGSSAAPQDVAVSSYAGAGMTATGSVLNVIGSTSITVNANDIQRPALTGFAAASANSNATTSAEPIVTYSASANMSAERVTTSSTSVTVSTSVANQIEFQRAAISGAVVLAANANTSVFAGIQDGGAATTDRTNLNFIDGTNTTAVLTDDAGGDRINIAVNVTGITSSGAVTGAVGILAGGGNATFNGILDNGAAENNRTLLNYVSGDSMSSVITDDAINDELEIRQHYVGNTAEIVNSTATGNLGTINIASLTCGGTYRVSAASSSFSIEGFTAKPVGFWFHFVNTDPDSCTLFHEDATATSTNRLNVPFGQDIVSTNGVSGILFYGGNTRWNWIAAGPAAIGTGSGNRVTCTSNQVNVLSSQATTIDAGTTLTATTTSGAMSFDSASTFTINTGTNDAVRLTSDSGGGFLKMAEDSASDPSVAAGDGMYWVRNDTPSVPMFTGDTNVDIRLSERGITRLDDEQTVAGAGPHDVTLTDGVSRLTFSGSGVNVTVNSITGGTDTGRVVMVYFSGAPALAGVHTVNHQGLGVGNSANLFNPGNVAMTFARERTSFMIQANGSAGWRVFGVTI